VNGAAKFREPDREDIAAFVEALFAYADESTYVSIRIFRQFDDGRIPPIINGVQIDGAGLGPLIDSAVTAARSAANANDPMVFCPPVATFTSESKATEEALACGLAISVELDHGNTRQARSSARACHHRG
jgi:hypothetical protein